MRISDWSSDVCSSDLECEGCASLLRGQVCVARGQSEAIGLANDRDARDLDREVEVANHAADDRELLVVLLAEHREVRQRDVERSEERRVGKECGSKGRSRWSPYH